MKKTSFAFLLPVVLALIGCFGLTSLAAASLTTFYKSHGSTLPPKSVRAQLAFNCGIVAKISDYNGTVAQNNALEECLKKGVEEIRLSGLVSKPYTFSPSSVIRSSEVNSNFDTLYTLVNGNIENANIASAAAITASKILGTAIVSAGTSAQTISATTTFNDTVFVSSTTGFFRVPLMTTAQRTALSASIQNGSIVYDTTLNQFEVYEAGSWTGFTPTAVTTLASLTAKGIAELATGAEAASSTPAGSGSTNAALVVHSSITTSSPTYGCNGSSTAGALCVPVAQNGGKLSDSFTDFSTAKDYTGTNRFFGYLNSSGGFGVSTTPSAGQYFRIDEVTITSSTVTSTAPRLNVGFIGPTTATSPSTTVYEDLRVNGNLSVGGNSFTGFLGQFISTTNATTTLNFTVAKPAGTKFFILRIQCVDGSLNINSAQLFVDANIGVNMTYAINADLAGTGGRCSYVIDFSATDPSFARMTCAATGGGACSIANTSMNFYK